MKTLITFLTTLFIGMQAMASVTANEFVTDFVNQTNRRLSYTNKERTAAKKRTNFCSSLSAEQVKTIRDIVTANPEITVGDFTSQLADSLKCFPEFWPPWSRTKTVRGMFVNTKAYIMDIGLVQDVLADLNENKLPAPYTKLLDSYNNWDFLKPSH